MRKTLQCLSLLLLAVLYLTTTAIAQTVYTAQPGKQIFTTGGGTFYDSGGRNGDYGTNEFDTIVFKPSSKDAKLSVHFNTFHTEGGYDFLYVYFGEVVYSKYLLDTYNGDYGQGITVTSQNVGEALTFVFTSDDATNDFGWDATITMGITAPSCPYKYSPQDGASGVSMQPTFYWYASTYASYYNLVVDNDTFKNIITTSYQYPSALKDGSTHSWEVIAVNDSGSSVGCATYTFTVAQAPSCVNYIQPINNAVGVATNDYLQWSQDANATSYDVYFGTNSQDLSYYTNTSSDYVYPSMVNNTKYFWKIVPKNDIGSASGCEVDSFTTADIAHYIHINSPNGGETYKGGDTITIKFSASTSLNDYFYLYLSTDGGVNYTSWLSYVYVSSAGEYTLSYVIPETVTTSSKCLFKVSDWYGYTGRNDVSDSYFTINALPPYFNIIGPAANAYILSGESATIIWKTNYSGTTYLYYSLNDGKDWTYIDAGTSYNTGTSYYYWYAPQVEGEYPSCKVKLVNADSSLVQISSNFTISSLSPLSFEAISDTLTVSSNYNIPVNNKSTTTYYDYLYYSVDNGATWSYYGSYYIYSGKNSLSFYVPYYSVFKNNCQFKLSNSNIYSEQFVIAPQPNVTITSPKTYDYLGWPANIDIAFSTAYIKNVNIEYSKDYGTTWISIASNYAVQDGDHSYSWQLPIDYSGYIYLRITDAQNNQTNYTVSYIYLIERYVQLLNPVGSVSFKAGETMTIDFKITQSYAYYYADISYDNGQSWQNVTYNYCTSTGNNSMSWAIPINTAPSNQCKLRLSYNNYTGYQYTSDISEVPFTITGPDSSIYSITNPSQGVWWKAGSSNYINWYSYQIPSVDLLYSTDNGSNWNTIASNLSSSDYDINSYYWTVPNTINGFNENSYIKVKAHNGTKESTSAKFILSDASASGLSFSTISDTVKANSYLYYNVYNAGSSQYEYIEYSLDNGSSWNNLQYVYLYTGQNQYSWYLPNGYYDKCMLRLNYSSVYSNTFTIAPDPTIYINTPSDYTTLPWGRNVDINFNSAMVDQVNIQYSLNGGTSWNNIVSNLSVINGANIYSWQTPDKTNYTDYVQLRISSTINSSVNDVNYYSFSDPTVSLYAPVAGESYKVGDTIHVSFNGSGYNYYYVKYSSNNGLDWSYLGYTYGTGQLTYDVVIPYSSQPGNNYKILVTTDYYNNSPAYTDISGTFNIVAGDPFLKFNGNLSGNFWQSGTTQYINWYSYSVKNVDIYYSLDNGKNWNAIATNIPTYDYDYYNSYAWTIPSSITGLNDSSLIKIKNHDSELSIQSSQFTISNQSPLVFISPKAGTHFKAGEYNVIEVKNRGQYLSGYYYLYYSLDSGKNWTLASYTYGIGQNSTYSYSWYTSWDLASKNCYLAFGPTLQQGVVSGKFVIDPAPAQINQVSSPSANAYLKTGSKVSINWYSISVAKAAIQLSIDGGTNWTNVATASATNGYNSYSWTVPSISGGVSGNCILKISNADSTALYAYSSTFAIGDVDQIELTSPAAGSTVFAGENVTIRYKNNGKNFGYMYLLYSNDSISWSYATSTYIYEGGGSFDWSVNSYLTTDSSFYFALADNDYLPYATTKAISKKLILKGLPAQISITSPALGDYLQSNSYTYIYWSSLHTSSVKIDYSTDKGSSWKSISTKTNTYDGQNSYYWNVPAVAQYNENCLIKITDLSDSKVADTSDLFIVSPKSQLRIISPIAGDVYKAGNTVNINLYNYGKYIYKADLYYFANNGGWYSIGRVYDINPGTKQYQWTIPNSLTESDKYQIVSYESLNSSYDTSAVFTIKGADPSMNISYPIAGSVLWSKDWSYISYTYVNISKLDILMTTDGGTKWDTLQLNVTPSGSYQYQVPVVKSNSDNCMVKLIGTSTLGTKIEAVSLPFTIKNEPTNYIVTQPNGGETYTAGDYINLQFTNTGKGSYANLYYNLNGGKWNYITNVQSKSGTNYYQWQIPMDTKKSKAKFIVADYYDNSIKDSSDNSFSIQMAAPYISIQYPQSNSLWISNKSYTVGFNSLNVADAIIDLSTDGGTTYKSLDTLKNAIYGYNSKTVVAPVVDTTVANTLLRVRSKINNKVYDVRNIVLSPKAPAILVTSPNGGESFVAGNYIPVKVNNIGSSTYCYVYLSTDSGANWNYYGYFYVYNGSNSLSVWMETYFAGSTNCLVKVVPTNTETHTQDMSNAVFTIKAVEPSITIYSPYAGASYWSNETTEVSFYTVNIGAVKIEYSADNKKTWSDVVVKYSTSNGNHSYNWTLPVITGKSDSCFVKISSGDVSVISNRFSIHNEPASIVVTSPNGGESYKAGSYIPVEYTYTGRSIEYCEIFLSTDSGKTKKSIGKDYSISSGNQSFYYTIPQESKTYKNCFVYVEEGNAATPATDRSNGVFKINTLPPYITVSTPSKYDYIVGGNSYVVAWNSYKVSKAVIQYTTDGGKTWQLLDPNVSSVTTVNGDNQFSYIAPKVVGTFNNCYIRVKSATDTTVVGKSSVFTMSDIPESIAITSPNGGEVFQAGNTYTVTFDKTGPKNYTWYYVQLSTNGGIDYTNLGWVYAYNKGEYSWHIDETLASKYCKIRIYNNDFSDESDNMFEITAAPAQISVTNPTASANWQSATQQYIGWDSRSVEKVNIYLTMDAGLSWKAIATNVYSNYGMTYYTFLVDTLQQNEYNCKVKVVSVADTNVFGVSSTFTILSTPASITLTGPNGGEVIKSGSSYFVTFTYSGAPTQIGLAVSTNGGSSWEFITSKVAKQGTNSFNWQVTEAPSTSCLVKVGSDVNNIFDYSDSYFTIVAGDPYVNVNNPSASSYFVSGSEYNINWTKQNIELVNVDYSLDAGSTWTTIASNYNGSNIDWTVPAVEKAVTNALIRVSKADDASVYDLSESFMINNEVHQLTIKSPNGGDTIKADTDMAVEVYNNGPQSTAKVVLFDGNTSSVLDYEKSINNGTTRFEVRVPAYAFSGANYKLRVRDNYAYGVEDVSDSVFTIIGVKPVINVNAPDSFNVWTKYENHNISWESYNVDSVKIEYTTDGGKTWITIDTLVEINSYQNSYNWEIPDVNAASKVAQVRVSDYANSTVYGLSKKFTLSGTPVSVTLKNFNGGEKMKAGSSDTLKFNYTGDFAELSLYLSTDSGMNFNKIENVYAKHGDNTFVINVPFDAQLSDKCLFRIVDASGAEDTSNAVFSIVSADPTVTVNAPEYGDYWVSKSVQTIKWFSWGVSKVTISYSIDGGTNYTEIRRRVPTWDGGENSYNFTIPDVVGHKDARVKIVSSSASTVASVSSSFIITNIAPGFTFSSPVKDQSWQAGASDSIKFEYNGKPGYASLYLSIDGGNTWTYVSGLYVALGKQSAYVNIPISTEASTTAMFKLALESDPSVSGSSAAFKITEAPATIELTSPVANAYLLSGSVASINWNSYSVKQVKLEYSIDNGANWTAINSSVTTANGENSYNWNVIEVDAAKKQSFIRITSLADAKVTSKSEQFTISNKVPSFNTRLVEIKVDGVALAKFDNEVGEYEYAIPFSATEAPVVTAKAEDANAHIEITNTVWFPGSTYVKVVAEDGLSERTFEINYYKAAASTDASLTDIKVDGKSITGFKPNVFSYKVELPAGTTKVPVVTVVTKDKYASVKMLNATKIPGTTQIEVIAEDEVTKAKYSVAFSTSVDVHTLAGVEVEIYPNPVREKLHIKNAENATVYLYNFSGQLVQSINNIENDAVMDVTSVAPGMYFVKIIRGNEIATEKVEILK